MKKLLSLLSLAVLVTAFGAGCGKHKACADAKGKGEAYCQKKENFENNKQCVWKKAASNRDADGECLDPPSADPLATDKAACSAVQNPTGQSDCDGVTLTAAATGRACKFVAAANNNAAKCELQ